MEAKHEAQVRRFFREPSLPFAVEPAPSAVDFVVSRAFIPSHVLVPGDGPYLLLRAVASLSVRSLTVLEEITRLGFVFSGSGLDSRLSSLEALLRTLCSLTSLTTFSPSALYLPGLAPSPILSFPSFRRIFASAFDVHPAVSDDEWLRMFQNLADTLNYLELRSARALITADGSQPPDPTR